MRKSLPLALMAGTMMISSFAGAQSDRFAYAVTGSADQTYNWLNLRKVNLETGEYSNVLLNGNDQSTVVFDAASRKQLTTPQYCNYNHYVTFIVTEQHGHKYPLLGGNSRSWDDCPYREDAPQHALHCLREF